MKSSGGLCPISAPVDNARPKFENNADTHTCVACSSTQQLNTSDPVLTSSLQHDLNLTPQYPAPSTKHQAHQSTDTTLVNQTIERVPSPCDAIRSNDTKISSACDQSPDGLTNGQIEPISVGDPLGSEGQQSKESQSSDTACLLALPVDTSTDAEVDVCSPRLNESNEQCQLKRTQELKG